MQLAGFADPAKFDSGGVSSVYAFNELGWEIASELSGYPTYTDLTAANFNFALCRLQI